MGLLPLKIDGHCVLGDEKLLENMEAAIARGYPELAYHEPVDQPLVLVASGPSIVNELETIRSLQDKGAAVAAVRGAHDWLIDHGIIPDYALNVDPLPGSWNCFQKKQDHTLYVLASQSDPAVFDYLEGCRILLWHPYITKGQTRPKDRMLVGGGTTSGLRALSVFYIMGYREFELFGYDCCMSGDQLRVDGSGPKSTDAFVDIQLEPDGPKFHCNVAMAQQAQHFEEHYDFMPGATFHSYGPGLITAIIDKRERIRLELEKIRSTPATLTEGVSFIHKIGPKMASFRYRCQMPAKELDWTINDETCKTLIFAKPQAEEVMEIARAQARGQWVVVDFCDDHFDWPYYQEALRLADAVTCNTEVMAQRILARGRKAQVIPDPWEFPVEPPHCGGTRLLWFGHESNKMSLSRIMPDLEGYELRVVSNFGGAIPWSHGQMLMEFARADIVILPATEEYKSANRAVEAIRQGCFVVAEPHPAWNAIPGIFIGNIKDGIEWTGAHCTEANRGLLKAQSYVAEKYSPKTAASAWKKAIQQPTISGRDIANGPAGSTLTLETQPT